MIHFDDNGVPHFVPWTPPDVLPPTIRLDSLEYRIDGIARHPTWQTAHILYLTSTVGSIDGRFRYIADVPDDGIPGSARLLPDGWAYVSADRSWGIPSGGVQLLLNKTAEA